MGHPSMGAQTGYETRFPPGTDKRIHIAIDGERCLKKRLAELSPEATFALDIIHVEEKLWKIGRAYYGLDSHKFWHQKTQNF